MKKDESLIRYVILQPELNKEKTLFEKKQFTIQNLIRSLWQSIDLMYAYMGKLSIKDKLRSTM